MKLIKRVLAIIVLVVVIVASAWKIGVYQYEQEEIERHEQMCKLIDERLISSGMVECYDGK